MRICILGDNLSAIVLAKALINQKFYIDILTKKKPNIINQSRTISISKSNVDFFNNNIININKFLWHLKKIEIFTDNLKNEKILNFQNDKKQIFSIIKNKELYEFLEKNLLKNKYFRKKLYKKKDLSFLEKYDLVINCDFSHELTNKYFSKKISKKYNSLAYTTIIEHKKIENNIATQFFTKNGPLAFLPIGNNKTSVVYSINSSKIQEEDNIKNLIKLYGLKYKIIKINKIEIFELQSLNLRQYYHKNILAFGDLLHKIHPLAGQGFNMTLRDIKILLNIIKNRLDLGLQIDNSINEDFEKKLKYKNLIFSSGIDLIHEFFNLESKIPNDILSKSTQFLGKNPSINRIFSKIADKGILS
jgi:2-octaprenyl-6-methoxyphenol hydroxylase